MSKLLTKSFPNGARSWWQIAEDEGMDMSLLEDSLSKSVAERLRENSRALALIEALEEAMKRRGGS